MVLVRLKLFFPYSDLAQRFFFSSTAKPNILLRCYLPTTLQRAVPGTIAGGKNHPGIPAPLGSACKICAWMAPLYVVLSWLEGLCAEMFSMNAFSTTVFSVLANVVGWVPRLADMVWLGSSVLLPCLRGVCPKSPSTQHY